MRQWIGVVLCCLGLAGSALAETAEAIRERALARRPVIASLVEAGVVAEAPTGYLVIRDADALGERRTVVAAENADRRKAYAAIAAKTGVSVDVVARRQAERLRARRAD